MMFKSFLHHCFLFSSISLIGQSPEILNKDMPFLPDFSYAGYNNGLDQKGDFKNAIIVDVGDYGAFPNDGIDDSQSLKAALAAVKNDDTPAIIQLDQGEYILSDILYITRSNLVIRGTGSGEHGTSIYCPRPMRYFDDPESLKELREYLVKFDKQQREKKNNIDLPFSQYAWSGGMIWVRKENTRVKSYLPEYKKDKTVLSDIVKGKRGELNIEVSTTDKLSVGDVVQLEWYNKEGENGTLIDALYNTRDVKIGSHHWNFPDEPLIKQQVRITSIKGNRVTISSPLLIDIKPEWHPIITQWKHIEKVGIEHLQIKFPMAETIAHHVEEGFNAIYYTRLYDGWVDDVKIINSDAGILTEEVANVSITNIETTGDKLAHYSVYIGGVHNVLVDGLRVANRVRHPLSFNTFATKSVFKDCEVLQDPILDQHAGANHQNLFDHVKVHISLEEKSSYPLFAGGGAGYWKPSHGSFSTFWNIEVHFLDGLNKPTPILLNGMKDGTQARLIGIHGNKALTIDYEPDAYIEWINREIVDIPSLYAFQLKNRQKLKKKK